MKIAVLSDCRLPSLPVGGHGLGRLCVNLATVLSKRGHDVTLYAGKNSAWNGKLEVHADETDRAKTMWLDFETIYIDCSHRHELSQHHPDYKIINWILDGECLWQPPNALVSTEYDRQFHPTATVMPAGVNVDEIPFYEKPMGNYLTFAAKIHPHKGYSDALVVHKAQDMPVKFVGERFVDDWLPDWRDTLKGKAFYDFVGKSIGLLHPINAKRQIGGGLMPLEAGAMGVPSIVYDTASPRYHVKHGVSGWIVGDVGEMIDAVQDLRLIDRKKCRKWVADTHSLDVMVQSIEAYIEKTFSKVGV